jgi:hypothetical protein
MKRALLRLCLGLWVLVLFGSTSRADVLVHYGFQDLGGGLFQYNLFVTNGAGGTEALSGLSILAGNSLFGLDDTSTITAPQNVGGNPAANWSFFAPLPPLVDNLDYFSLSPAADIPVGGTLGGFSFQSFTAPDTLGSGFDTVVVTSDTNTQIPVVATPVPEPASMASFAIAAFVLCSAVIPARCRHTRLGSR